MVILALAPGLAAAGWVEFFPRRLHFVGLLLTCLITTVFSGAQPARQANSSHRDLKATGVAPRVGTCRGGRRGKIKKII